MKKKVFLIIVLFLIILFVIIFVIDKYRMKNNMSVLFSTWGNKYLPIISKEDSKSFELIVKKSNEISMTKITTEEFREKYGYDVYYYGIRHIEIKFTDVTIDLKEALLTDRITMENIIDKAYNDFEQELISSHTIYDGSVQFKYKSYTIIKRNTPEGNNNVYIGVPQMGLEIQAVL